MKKNSLPVESALLPITCVGIVSQEKDYRLCYSLNKELNIKLVKNNSSFHLERDRLSVKVPFFHASDVECEYYILENKVNSVILIPEFKNINYWMIIRSRSVNLPKTDFLTQLKSIDGIITSFVLHGDKEIRYLNELILQ